MKRSTRVVIAQQTLEILDNGFYASPTGHRVDLSDLVTAARESSFLYESADMPAPPLPTQETDALLEVTNESSFAALHRLNDSGEQLGLLNFASAKNPGGGFLSGAEAQEEAISRASALYPSLLSQPSYYQQNRAHSSCLYLDLLIVSPKVPFFRTDDGSLLGKPVLATVVTAPAPNAGAVRRNEPECASEILPTLHRRAELVIRAFALARVEVPILGAWGCGVFQNDPVEVAQTFAALVGPGGLYARHFKKVVFAIYDPSGQGANLRAFREVFHPTL